MIKMSARLMAARGPRKMKRAVKPLLSLMNDPLALK